MATFSSELKQALRRDDAGEVTRLMNSVGRTRPHQKRALKLLMESFERGKPAVTRALLTWGADANGVVEETLDNALVACGSLFSCRGDSRADRSGRRRQPDGFSGAHAFTRS
jgi:hypothetical protein